MKKKLISIFLALLTVCALLPGAGAANVSADQAIDTLMALGLARGTGEGFEPDRPLTRAQAAVMLVRLLGCEPLAEEAELPSGFSDVPVWAEPAIGWARAQGIILGRSETWFGADEQAQVRDYLTFALRALGYREGEDFLWREAVAFADRIGLTHGEYTADTQLLREDMALISYTALTLRVNGGERTLAEQLYLNGIISYGDLKNTRLAAYANADKQVLSSREIYEKASASVFFVEVFDTEDDLRQAEPSGTGSGFFISADGLALMSYHELDGCSHARITTTDGRQYELASVLYYDAFRDLALVRIADTDLAGRSVRFFPYLELGDSDTLGSGEIIYTISSPNGLQDSISQGMVSTVSRVVDDPDYPCIQITAPISSGSSGGALLNVYGEAVGVIFGSFISGQSLNLAVPVNALPADARLAEGQTLARVREAEDAKKAAAVLTVPVTDLTLMAGESREIMVSHTGPGMVSIQYQIQEPGIVSCEWGKFETKRSVPLTITGESEGTCTVEITFVGEDFNPEAKVSIHVTVLPDPNAPAEETPAE